MDLWAMGGGCGLGQTEDGTEGGVANGGRQSQADGERGRMKLTMEGEREHRAQEAGGDEVMLERAELLPSVAEICLSWPGWSVLQAGPLTSLGGSWQTLFSSQRV